MRWRANCPGRRELFGGTTFQPYETRFGDHSGGRRMEPRHDVPTAARTFLALADDGKEAPSQRSVPRTLFALLMIAVWAFAAPLLWTSSAFGNTNTDGVALVANKDGEDDGEDNSGPGGGGSSGSGDDDDDTTTSGMAGTTGTATTDAAPAGEQPAQGQP